MNKTTWCVAESKRTYKDKKHFDYQIKLVLMNSRGCVPFIRQRNPHMPKKNIERNWIFIWITGLSLKLKLKLKLQINSA